DGHPLLGDFGAASFFGPEDRQHAKALQRIEVRAFACLLEELLERCSAEDSQVARKTLVDLHARCAQQDSAARPLFAEIEQVLLTLQ
ncbi:MAG TPA: protein kinase, partial [Sideroxyarcus sp.]|nr:protein kinase [Sideroxyarcus sp.]